MLDAIRSLDWTWRCIEKRTRGRGGGIARIRSDSEGGTVTRYSSLQRSADIHRSRRAQARVPEPSNRPESIARRKIQNVRANINERLAEYPEDIKNLDERCPGDDIQPGLSRWGHRMLINKDKRSWEARPSTAGSARVSAPRRFLRPLQRQHLRRADASQRIRPLTGSSSVPVSCTASSPGAAIIAGRAFGGTILEDVGTGGVGIYDPVTIGVGGGLIWKGWQILVGQVHNITAMPRAAFHVRSPGRKPGSARRPLFDH